MIIALKIPMQEFIMHAYGEMLSLSFSEKDMSSMHEWVESFKLHFIFSGICHFFEQIIPWLIDQNCVNTKRQFINLPLLLNPTHLQGFCVLSSKSLWTRAPLKKPEKVCPSFGRGGNREKFFSNDCEFFFVW